MNETFQVHDNQCLSPLFALTLLVRMPFKRGVLNTTLCGKVCQLFATSQWFPPPKNIVESGVKHLT
jgi:hypothetical protein